MMRTTHGSSWLQVRYLGQMNHEVFLPAAIMKRGFA